ncbi:addiction module killer protein [Pasteurella multocida subsp. gallicida str. Anand1_poultry]|nr:addiction module killer protein [Pasteurella multocida subsp. gallicida str. Anand1_poultry]
MLVLIELKMVILAIINQLVMVYYAQYKDVTYLLICGGDKSTQKADIAKAKALWEEIKQKEGVNV